MIEKYYRSLFFLCPFLIEQFDVTGYDLVISSSAAFSRGVMTRPDQPHLCYVHSPVRYAWDEQFSYLQQGRLGFGPKGLLFRYMLHRLRTWDTRTAHGPDMMLANSSYVRSRIRHIYGRDSEVVFPPVALDELTYAADKDDYYVVASYLAPYKRTDLVIQAFNEMRSRRLVVVGEGQQSKALEILLGPTSPLPATCRAPTMCAPWPRRGRWSLPAARISASRSPRRRRAARRWWRSAAAAPRHRQAVRLRRRPTGLLFRRQTAAALKEAVEAFEDNCRAITPVACRANGSRFSEDRFDRALHNATISVQAKHAF